MAATKETQKSKLTAGSLRDMSAADRTKLLAEKRTDLLELKRSLKAQELANPRKVKELRREIARLLTVENEPRNEESTAPAEDKKENK